MSGQSIITKSEPLIVYGLGSTGQKIVDDLIAGGISVDLILDRGKDGQEYRGIPIAALEQPSDARITGKSVLVALHNHYVDVNQLHSDLLQAGAGRVLSPINLPEIVPGAKSGCGYWLDPEFDMAAHDADFVRVRALLADDRSRELFDAVVQYRRSGDLAHCPAPSTTDEYMPKDLPRYAGPLRLIDCGAWKGVAVQKLLSAGYAIDSLIAFEPDPTGYSALVKRSFPIARRIFLPLAAWSETTQLRFSVGIPMGGQLSDEGNIVVQCGTVDELLHGETVNVVKLDIEGAEIDALKGMARTIREQRPNLLVSAYHAPAHLYEIIDLVDGWNLGYRFHLRVHEHNTFGAVIYCIQPELTET